jgi:hypothetical protein
MERGAWVVRGTGCKLSRPGQCIKVINVEYFVTKAMKIGSVGKVCTATCGNKENGPKS